MTERKIIEGPIPGEPTKPFKYYRVSLDDEAIGPAVAEADTLTELERLRPRDGRRYAMSFGGRRLTPDGAAGIRAKERGELGMTQTYRGCEISWDEPPRMTSDWSFNVASNDPGIMARLQQANGGHRGAVVVPATTKEEGLKTSRAFIDRALT